MNPNPIACRQCKNVFIWYESKAHKNRFAKDDHDILEKQFFCKLEVGNIDTKNPMFVIDPGNPEPRARYNEHSRVHPNCPYILEHAVSQNIP